MIKFGLKLRKRSLKNKHEKDKVRISEFMCYADLIVVDKGKTNIEKLGIEDCTIHKTAPSCCPECSYKTIVAVQVLGALDETLFWMCDDCGALFLKLNEVETEILLEKSSHFWTNHSDWGIPEESELN